MSFWSVGAISEFRSQVTNSLTAYFKIWDFVCLRIEQLLGANLHIIPNEQEFWQRVLRRNSQLDRSAEQPDTLFHHGDQVSLKGWYLSDWIPRMPGALWVDEFHADLSFGKGDLLPDFPLGRVPKNVRTWVDAFRHLHPMGIAMAASLPVYDWFGKTRLCLSGVGSLRLPLGLGDENHYACLSAVTSGSWHVHTGIPVVVSRQVYREFDRARDQSETAPECDLQGRIVIGELPPFFTQLPLAIGEANVPDGGEQVLRRTQGVPMAYVHITSPLDCDFRTNDSHPDCNAWTLFRIRGTESLGKQNLDVARMLEGIGTYGITYHPFQPLDSQSLQIATHFLRDSPRWLHATREQRWNNWLDWGDTPADNAFSRLAESWASLEIQIVTDFDGITPRLTNAMFNLTSPPSRQSAFEPFCADHRNLGPSAPTSLRADKESVDGSFRLWWDSADSDIATAYNIYRKDRRGRVELIASVPGKQQTIPSMAKLKQQPTDGPLWYYVSVLDGDLEGAKSKGIQVSFPSS